MVTNGSKQKKEEVVKKKTNTKNREHPCKLFFNRLKKSRWHPVEKKSRLIFPHRV